MAKVQAYVLDGGKDQILAGSAGFGRYVPYSFSVGDSANYTPLTSETAPRGNLTYVGNAQLMQSRIVSEGVVRFSLIIPEGAGPFNVGNVVMYTIGGNYVPVPFIMVVLPYVIPKKVSAYDTGTVGLSVPGNRLLINITLTQQIINADDTDVTVNIQIVSPQYTNMSYIDTEANIPAPELMPWNQMIIAQTDLTGGPGFISKDNGNKFWIIPFFKDLHSPSYNSLGGGVAGDGHKESTLPILWGHRLKTPNNLFRAKIGGAPFLNAGTTPGSVGGAPFILPQNNIIGA